MEIPEKWVKDTINCWVFWRRIYVHPSYEYQFSIHRSFLKKGWLKITVKTEKLTEISTKSSHELKEQEIEKLHFYTDFLKIAREVQRLSKGSDWRARALDALSSPMVSEKDKFLSDFIESFNKKQIK